MHQDKIYHFIAGAATYLAFGFLFSPMVGLTACIVVGAGKELVDMAGYGTPEILDFIATVAGGLLMFMVLR